MVILSGHIDTLFHVEQTDITSLPQLISVLRQAHLDAALHVVGSACQNRAVSWPDLICSALFQCVNCAWFDTEQSYFFDWLNVRGLRNFYIVCYKVNYSNQISMNVFDIDEVYKILSV